MEKYNKIKRRKENLIKMRQEIKKQVKINKKRETISLKYAKHNYSD